MAVNINVARLSITVTIFCRYNVSFRIIMQQYIVIATMGLLVNLVDTLTFETEYSLLGPLYANATPTSFYYVCL